MAYNDRKDTSLVVASKTHFWLGWFFGLSMTLSTIVFEFAFLPGIRVWYRNKTDGVSVSSSGAQSAGDDLDNGPITFGDPNAQPSTITTFLSDVFAV